MQRNLRKNVIVIVILSILMVYLLNFLRTMDSSNEVDYSEFLRMVNSGQVTFVSVGESMLDFKTPEQTMVSRKPPQISNLSETLLAKNIDFKVEKKEGPNLFVTILYAWLPVLLIVGVILMFSKQFQGGGKGIMGFSKFKPKKTDENAKKYTFDDVAGIEDAKQEVLEIVEYLKNPQKFNEIGAKIPTGVLLSGSPGTGKTLLAKAIAGEAGVPFFNISGSDFVEMFVGVGAARVRDLFENARTNSPCIVFIDEIDAVGRNRGSGLGGGNDEREQTLNQLLVEMDGFSGKEGIIVIAATNRPDVLDSALTRPGRLDRQVVVSPPDLKGRSKILKIHSQGLKLDSSVDLEKLAQLTVGYTGADLANLCNEAALLAGRNKKTIISISDFEDAWNKILMGPERKTLTQSEQELKTTSYHEAGHALINVVCKFLDPLHKVSVVPRGRALGVSISVPDKESFSNSKEKLWQMIQMIMGGRAAEEIIFNHYTSGASNDLERATSIAHQMVCSWGMSEEIGPVYLSDGGNGVFLGREFMQDKMISDKLAKKVDFEVKNIVNQGYLSAKSILENNLDALHEIAEKLLKEETIEGSEVSKIVFKG